MIFSCARCCNSGLEGWARSTRSGKVSAGNGFPREPSTVSAVRRIADATGATGAEVLALLGVEDINSRRILRPITEPEGTTAGEAKDATPGTFGA